MFGSVMMRITYSPLGDEAIVIEVGQEITKEATDLVRAITKIIEETSIDTVVEVIPAFTTVTVFYKVSAECQYDDMKNLLTKYIVGIKDVELIQPRTIEIPVCYGGEYGPDLEHVATHNQLTVDEFHHLFHDYPQTEFYLNPTTFRSLRNLLMLQYYFFL